MANRKGMSTADAAWLHMDRPTNLMVINSVLWFDEPIDWPATQAILRKRLVEPFPRFRQIAVDGRPGATPAWEDDPRFDLALHVHRRGVPAPGDRRALQELVSDLVAAPLDRTKPLWDAYLLEGYGSGCALLVRMHHAIADGIALGRVLLSLTDSDGQPAEFAPDPRPEGGGVRASLASIARPASAAISATRAIAHEGVETLLHPERFDTLAHTVEADARVFAKFLLPGTDARSALKGDLGVAHRVAWSTVSLATVKRTARAFDATVNDVLVAAVAGAVGAHLRARGDEVDEVHALVPFNLRSLDEPLPRDLGNRFGLVLLGLPVGIEDPVERLGAVQERMQAIKRSHEGAIAYGILGVIGRTPPLVEERLVNFFSAKGTMVLTNVPGPRRPVTLAATPVRGVLVWAPCSGGVGMSVSVFSYAGKVTVGFLVDAGLVADPQPLAAGVRRDVLDLARVARSGRRAG